MTEKPIISVIGTVKSRLPDLAIKDGQLIFVQDNPTIALDFNGKRTFYNEIIEVPNEEQRLSILAPISGAFYFVVSSAVLWTYQDTWVQITTPPKEILFIGTEFPHLGSKETLYVNSQLHTISIWDDTSAAYDVVADRTEKISESDIGSLFL